MKINLQSVKEIYAKAPWKALVAAAMLVVILAIVLLSINPWTTLFFVPMLIVGGFILLVNAIVMVPRNHYGTKLRLGERLPGALMEGWHKKWPFIEEVEIISTELDEMDINATLTTADNLGLTVKGSLQYSPDPRITECIRNRQGEEVHVNKFIGISDAVIRDGIKEMIEAILGTLGGQHEHEVFIKQRLALGVLVNAILILRVLPHEKHTKYCKKDTCPWKNQDLIEVEKLLDFYLAHRHEVSKAIKRQRGVAKHESEVEERYGISIETFALSKVTFSADTAQALEEKKRAEFRKEAATVKLELVKEFKGVLPNASPQLLLNAADTTLDPSVNKSITSVEGEAGVLGAIAALTGNSSGGSGKKGKKG